jgi:hypothetical protein
MKNSKRIDWDEVSRQIYASELTRPESWIVAANELLAAATLLEAHVEAWWQSVRVWAKHQGTIFSEHGCHGIYMMLCAFAIENLCKSMLISSLTPDEREQVRERGLLPKRFKNHDVVDLVKSVHLSIDIREEELLRRMARAAVWHGRYPVPVSHRARNAAKFSNGKEYSTSWQGGADIARIKEFVHKLRGHVKAPETYHVASVRADPGRPARVRKDARG